MMNFLIKANGFFWGGILAVLLIGGGLYLTILLRFPLIKHFKDMLRSITLKGPREDGISSFAALATVVGSQVGTGNLAGVATALASGGPGAVFWMWITAVVGTTTIFAENVLAIKYRLPSENNDGTYVGGPAYYMEQGLKSKALGTFFAIAAIAGIGTTSPMMHAYSIATGFKGVMDFSPLIIGITISILTGLVIMGGIKSISNFAEKVVPFMTAGYLLIAFYIVGVNITKFPAVIALIFKSAFGTKQVVGGLAGFTIKEVIRHGTARGLFSNEAGQGTTPNINATANVYHPVTQGFSAMLAVVIDTIIVCSATAFIVLVTGALESGKSDLALTQEAFGIALGGAGKWLIFLAIAFFAFTSLISCCYMGEVNVRYLSRGKNTTIAVRVYQLFVLICMVISAVMAPEITWQITDFSNAMMVLSNLTAVLLLSKEVKEILNDYESQVKRGVLIPKYWDKVEAN